jgi:nitroimidazol reductase NimA-like FMN-containing flavoprotein (pyridoxamine 5'-phosphate oxidase superfamily)
MLPLDQALDLGDLQLCFGYGQGAIYFHAAKEGRKREMLSKNSKICFGIDID